MRRLLAAAISLLFASAARAQSFPARTGETGILDVPDAEVTNLSGQLAAELRFDRAAGMPDEYGPLPIYAVAGLMPVLDLGLTMRESGQPGDPRPERLLFGAALKLQLWEPDGAVPGAAISAVIDRANARGVVGARLAMSTGKGFLRVAGFAGAEGEDTGSIGPTAGAALSLTLTRSLELAAEALTGPRGESFGGALRYRLNRTMGVSVGGNWFPGEEGFRLAVTLAISPASKATAPPPVAKPGEPSGPAVAAAPQFLDDRPKFRLRIPTTSPQQLGAPERQHGPFVAAAPLAAAPARPVEAPGAKAATPSLDDLADAQMRDQEALADAREKRVRAAGEQLDDREAAATADATKLATRERDLAAREQQIEAREKRTVIRTPSEPIRQLESLIAQIAAEERNLAAQEKSYGPALDAASGRERSTAAREQEERAQAARLVASIRSNMPRAAQIDLRKQALAARSRQLSAMETRLLARGERIDASERQLRTHTERVNAWSRRLDGRVERLDLIDKLLEPGRTTLPAPAPKPAEDKGAAAPPKDKAAFVMVVKAPTTIVKDRSGDSGGAAAGGSAPSVAVEKAVIAATVVMFPTPATKMSELDRETLDNIAKLAAKSGGELLVWARAKEPALVPEAERRAAEIRARATAAGPLEASRVTTRVTVRPGALGVDVVVSALRETAKPAAADEGQGPSTLLSGESGKRQIRDAVQSAQPSIEGCVGEHIAAKALERAEGVLKLTISRQGKVTSVTTSEGGLSGDQLDQCLGRASAGWRFPAADAEYVVDVPITVIRGGAGR